MVPSSTMVLTQFFLAGRAFLLAGHAEDPVLGLPAARRSGRDFGPAYTHSTTANKTVLEEKYCAKRTVIL